MKPISKKEIISIAFIGCVLLAVVVGGLFFDKDEEWTREYTESDFDGDELVSIDYENLKLISRDKDSVQFILKPTINTIEIAYDYPGIVSKFIIYRVNNSKDGEKEFYTKSDFEKIAEVKEKKYIDKDVHSGSSYGYFIEAIAKEKGKEKVVAYSDINIGWSVQPGLATPDLQITNQDSGKIYLNDNIFDGAIPTGYKLYRGNRFKHFEEIADIKVKKDETGVEFEDEFNENSTYKVVAYCEFKGEILYSLESNIVMPSEDK